MGLNPLNITIPPEPFHSGNIGILNNTVVVETGLPGLEDRQHPRLLLPHIA